MNEQHTRGPWHIVRFEANTVLIRNERGLTIAEVGDTSLEDEANARLIVEAPAMLKALRSAVDSLETLVKLGHIPASNKGLRDALVAIAIATGSKE